MVSSRFATLMLGLAQVSLAVAGCQTSAGQSAFGEPSSPLLSASATATRLPTEAPAPLQLFVLHTNDN